MGSLNSSAATGSLVDLVDLEQAQDTNCDSKEESGAMVARSNPRVFGRISRLRSVTKFYSPK